MKYQTISFFAAKGAIYYVNIAMVIFSRVKISCFHGKAHKSIRSTNITASSLSYKVFEKATNSALSKVKFGDISSLTEPQSRSLFSFLCGNDMRQNFLRIFKHSWKTTVKKITFLNVHFLCKKHFIDCLFVLSVVLGDCARNSPCATSHQIRLHGQFPRCDSCII